MEIGESGIWHGRRCRHSLLLCSILTGMFSCLAGEKQEKVGNVITVSGNKEKGADECRGTKRCTGCLLE